MIPRNEIFGWKIQVPVIRHLKDDTKFYQGFCLLCKKDQGYCDPTTRTQATIVCLPEDQFTTFQVAKIAARNILFHKNGFIASIPFEQVNQIRKNYQLKVLIETYKVLKIN